MPASARPTAAARGDLAVRNRRTAVVLIGWVLALGIASMLVAWFRN